MTVAPWIQSFSGGPVDLLLPQPDQVVANDLVVALCRIPRFNGHSGVFWSVAAHSLLVEELVRRSGASPMVRLWALLHDAHEAYTGAITAPMKTAINDMIDTALGERPGDGWVRPLRAIEEGLQAAIHRHFGIPPWRSAELDIVKLADLQALELERANFMVPYVRSWGSLPGVINPPSLERRSHEANAMEFSLRLEELLSLAGLPVCMDLWSGDLSSVLNEGTQSQAGAHA